MAKDVNKPDGSLAQDITKLADATASDKPVDGNANNEHSDGKSLTKRNKGKDTHNKSRTWKRGKNGRFNSNRNRGFDDHKRDNSDTEHLNYGPHDNKDKRQTLDLTIFEGSEVRANGLYPLIGKALKKHDVSVDWYKEVKATANGALNTMGANFMDADRNWALLESDVLDYINVTMTHSTYAQLPYPGWIYTDQLPDNLNPIQPWPGYGEDNYTSYTTRRCVELGKQLNTIAVTLQTNQSFANMPALNYVMCPYTPAAHSNEHVADIIQNDYQQDQNPFWRLYYTNGLLGWIDGVNTFMLTAVMQLYSFKRDKVMLEYFIKKHYILAPYLKLALGLYEINQFKAIIKSIERELSFIYCDWQWVDREARALLMISKANDTLWSPLLISDPQVLVPAYSMVAAGGTGISFSLNYNNGTLDGRVNPQFTTNYAPIHTPQLVTNLLQDLQQVIYNADGENVAQNLNDIATAFRQELINAAQNVLNHVQSVKAQLTGYNALMSQSVAGGFIFYAKHEWRMDNYDGEIAYVPQFAIILQHPEVAITSTVGLSGQFSASIALEKSRIEEALVDSTRYYAISGEWFFNMQINNFDNDMPQFMHYLQYTGFTFTREQGLTAVQLAPLNADNTLGDIFQLPEIIIYGWITVHLMNSGHMNFRLWSNYHRPLNAGIGYTVIGQENATLAYETLTWTGLWSLSDGEFITVTPNENGNYEYGRIPFVLSNGMGPADADEVNGYWTSSFNNLIDILGIMVTSSHIYTAANNLEEVDQNFYQNMVDMAYTRSVYTVCMPVTMRNTLAEMTDKLYEISSIASPLADGAVEKFTAVTAK